MTIYENEKSWTDVIITFVDGTSSNFGTDLIESFDGLIKFTRRANGDIYYPLSRIASIDIDDRCRY